MPRVASRSTILKWSGWKLPRPGSSETGDTYTYISLRWIIHHWRCSKIEPSSPNSIFFSDEFTSGRWINIFLLVWFSHLSQFSHLSSPLDHLFLWTRTRTLLLKSSVALSSSLPPSPSPTSLGTFYSSPHSPYPSTQMYITNPIHYIQTRIPSPNPPIYQIQTPQWTHSTTASCHTVMNYCD